MTAKGASAASTTEPIDYTAPSTAPRLAIAPYYRDPVSGAVYVHRDLDQREKPWEAEAHIGPINTMERFGDVESWVGYVQRFAGTDEWPPLLTWNKHGFTAILDYHSNSEDAGRCQWQAACPFVLSPEWRAWMALANGQPLSQRQAVEKLEDLAADIIDPTPADLVPILRNLRATVNATANTELRPDGTTSVAFTQDKTLKAAGNVDLPAQFKIAVRALTGHVDAAGKPVLYGLDVRVRVSVDDAAKLAFRFAIPGAERVLEAVYADRVAAAKALLGDGFSLLRAAD